MPTMESSRLFLRPLVPEDFGALCGVLQDSEVMYAWEHAFSDGEVREWIAVNRRRWETDGAGYLAAVERESGELIGTIGPLWETVGDRRVPGVGYLLRRDRWGRGLAREGAAACVNYAFGALGVDEVIAEIRPENLASRRVAAALGMRETGKLIKVYRGAELPHLIYGLTKEEYSQLKRERGNIYAEN